MTFFPFESLVGHAREVGLVVAVFIGIGFGFVLERAGFGRADKLAAQFYLRDMTVFKVMFSAIITAMLGLVVASSLGLADLRSISESIASWTWIWPMLIGGVLLGIGFIVSGYCPGTSLVAMASGNIDGAFAFAGVVTGTFVYSELLRIPQVEQFHNSGARGALFLYDLLPVAPEVLAAVFAVVAILAFIGAEKVESLVSGDRPPSTRSRRLAFATLGVAATAAAFAVLIPHDSGAAPAPAATITASELAKRLIDEPWQVRVVDTRPNAASRIPTSEVIGAKDVADLPDDGRTLVVIGDAAHLPRHARVLAGGIPSWDSDPLAKALTSGAPPPPPPTRAAGTFAKPKKKGGGCSA